MKKTKTYVLMLSKVFPATHPKAGQPTFFKERLNGELLSDGNCWRKLHTIRDNYNLWDKRIGEINGGDAELSIRQWSGKPYNSPMIEIARLGASDGVDLQMIRFNKYRDEVWVYDIFDNYVNTVSIEDLAFNDGLSVDDWRAWFKNCDFTKPMAVIHFTDFRY